MKTISWKIRDNYVNELFFSASSGAFDLRFAQNLYFGDFFSKQLSVFDENENAMTLVHLNRYNSKHFRENRPKLCINT